VVEHGGNPPQPSLTPAVASRLEDTNGQNRGQKKKQSSFVVPGRSRQITAGDGHGVVTADVGGGRHGEDGVPSHEQHLQALPITHGDVVFWQWLAVQPPQPTPPRFLNALPPQSKSQQDTNVNSLHTVESLATVFDTSVRWRIHSQMTLF
jgi:hypothetical protein